MYQRQNILCYQLSATIIIHEQRLFANLEDINFAYYTYMYTWFTEDGTINFLFLPSVSLSIRNSSSPSTSTTTADKTQAGAGIRKEKLLSSAPVISFGVDLEHWENPNKIEAPQIIK